MFRLVILTAILLLAVGLFRQFGDQFSLAGLADREAEFRSLQERRPGLVYGMAFGVYVTVTGLSLPGAAGMSLAFGWLFGFRRALLLVSFASTAGASLAFLLSRYLLRDVVQQRFGERLAPINDAFARDGAYFLFSLRLIPAVPFFLINVLMALTPIRLWTFWWVSQLGMLPGTAVYVYAGSSVPNLRTLADQGATGILTPHVLLAFTLLGLFPILIKSIAKRIARSGKPSSASL